uniref:Ankyrin repeat and zinc finger peptidyl tRNA hydrolase 1 n=2 Tax=Paramormyrops kingsleyae TaxID=1676925 RepID=A0A3B3SBC4_9TELE|nr:ankyrin repeat and zinc finger domain-containing protein 1 isoform X1 [Paramormyrops kingsleyae]
MLIFLKAKNLLQLEHSASIYTMTALPEHRSVFDCFQDTTLLQGLEEVTTVQVVTPLPTGTGSHRQAGVSSLDRSPHGEVSDKMFCSACQCPFDSREEQTEHYKLDWHRFNLRQRLAGRSPVTVEDFERKTGTGDVSSISGSDSEEDASDSDWGLRGDEDSAPAEAESPSETEARCGRLACKALFRNLHGQYLSVFRCVLCSKKTDSSEVDLTASLLNISCKSVWVILMTGGGHFAGAVFQGKEILQHKTFHRYTVRAKRGTAQGLRDSQNHSHAPRSAGAALRRYNEAALVKDVQDLLEGWSEHLREASVIFLRVPSYSRTMFFGGRQAPLDKSDPRVRTVPFATRRATFCEIRRVHDCLSTLHIYGKDTKVSTIFSPQKKVKKTPRPVPQTDLEIQVAAPPVTDEEDTSGEGSSEVALEMVEETLGTLDLRESEMYPCRRRRRRKKETHKPQGLDLGSGEPEGQREDCVQDHADSQEAGEVEACRRRPRRTKKAQPVEEDARGGLQGSWEYSLRDALFTACKVGDLDTLRRLLQPTRGSGQEQDDRWLPKGLSPVGGALIPVQPAFLNMEIDDTGFTLLHVASAAGQRGAIKLLMDAGSDPACRDIKGRTPYNVAPEKDTRNAFRKYMAENPDKYDYDKAQIPGPLTAEIETKKAEKKRAQKAARKQREKDQKEEKRREEAEQEEKRRFAALSDREKRALAAEKRLQQQMAAMGSSFSTIRRCWQCGESLMGKVPFQYLDFSFCTPRCVQEHRKAQALNPKP